MASGSYRGDIWIYSIRIKTGVNDTLVVTENGTTKSVQIPAGRYWAWDPRVSGIPSSEYPSLINAIQDALDNAFTSIHSTTQQTPTGSGIPNLGLQWIFPADNITLEFADGSFTFPPEWLGWPPDQSSDISTTNGKINSPYSWRGTTFLPRASDKRRRPETTVARSSDDASEAYNIRWANDDRRRQFRYEAIHAARVWGIRGRRGTQADAAGLPTGDVNNGWYDCWDSMVTHDAIVAHNIGGDDFDFGFYNPTQLERGYEVVTLDDRRQEEGFAEIWSDDRDFGAERYDLTMTTDSTGDIAPADRYEH
jgi:hypothetical protein